MLKKNSVRTLLFTLIILICVPVACFAGTRLLGDKAYAFISVFITAVACGVFFFRFEQGREDARRVILIAVMTALTVVSRFVFAVFPSFKPITAMVVITALYFGGEAGFMTGAMAALISNFYFGQGPWTPFQMFAWGAVGYIAGLLAVPLKRNRVLLCVYGAAAGVAYSLFLDVFTVLWYEGRFDPALYLTSVAAALPFTVVYAVSNVVFLMLLSPLLGKKLTRIKLKYGI